MLAIGFLFYIQLMMAYTTADVPQKITRFMREKVSPDSVLVEGWSWTQWMLAMTPKNHGDFRRRETADRRQPGYKILKEELKRQFGDVSKCYGVYEWMARHTKTRKEYVVHIGCTCRNKRGKFIDRIYEYCSTGSHKALLINSALENEYELLVRFKGSAGDDSDPDLSKYTAECDENAVLRFYDYAWNVRSVKQIDRNLP